MPDSQRGFKLRSMSAGRSRRYASSPNSYPSSREGSPKRRSKPARPSRPAPCFANSSPACSISQSITGCSTGTSPWICA
eukprot:12922311-Alexandrium_andersonii.AAC.1